MMQVREFIWKLRIYYEDTDAAGVVYHSNYLKFMERARTEWLRALGVEQGQLLAETGVVFVIRQAKLTFRQPARYGDELNVISRLTGLRPMRMNFVQQIVCDRLLVEGEIEVVSVNAMTFKPVKIPERIQQLLEELLWK